jgi:hypothetical protein
MIRPVLNSLPTLLVELPMIEPRWKDQVSSSNGLASYDSLTVRCVIA